MVQKLQTVTRVVHCKKEPYDIYIGRGGRWGNPFSIGVDGTRQEVIEKYRQFVLQHPQLLENLHELKGKVLGCWCKPNACHGDVLVELIEQTMVDALFTNPSPIYGQCPYCGESLIMGHNCSNKKGE
jgi:hypothetical protein